MIRIINDYNMDKISDTCYNIIENLWNNIIIENYSLHNLFCNHNIFKFIRHYFYMGNDKNVNRIVFNECNLEKYIGESFIRGNNVVGVNTNNHGYSIQYMINRKTDIIEKTLDHFSYPDCKIDHFPYKYRHCEIWARKVLLWLKQNNDITIPPYEYMINIFNTLFNSSIQKLLDTTENWDIPKKKPKTIPFDNKNEKHLYFLYQLSDLYKCPLNHKLLLNYDKPVHMEIVLGDEITEMTPMELNIYNTLIYFRKSNYDIIDSIDNDLYAINNIIALIDTHKSIIYNEELNIYNYKNNIIKSYPKNPVENKSMEYHPLYMSQTRCIPENHTIWDTFVIKIDDSTNCNMIKEIINKKYGVDVIDLYMGDKQLDNNENIKIDIDYMEITPLINSDIVVILPTIYLTTEIII